MTDEREPSQDEETENRPETPLEAEERRSTGTWTVEDFEAWDEQYRRWE
jgi:hypothetical protein